MRDIAWIWLTPNPWHNPEGDFALKLYTVSGQGSPKWNFANIGVYRPEMFAGITPGQKAGLGKLLFEFADQGRIGGEIYQDQWVNVGTVRQLEDLNA